MIKGWKNAHAHFTAQAAHNTAVSNADHKSSAIAHDKSAQAEVAQRAYETGSRGGQFYTTATGAKVYVNGK